MSNLRKFPVLSTMPDFVTIVMSFVPRLDRTTGDYADMPARCVRATDGNAVVHTEMYFTDAKLSNLGPIGLRDVMRDELEATWRAVCDTSEPTTVPSPTEEPPEIVDTYEEFFYREGF